MRAPERCDKFSRIQHTTVHYLVSPPRPPRKTNPQAKATF
ncbi:hypothetical protein HF786_002538 [Salmonella enterica]|nr:hypothetical protein [Salmonella enterica]EKL2089265.1 hypothetical protein [Salmonella enterica]EKO1311220.1 hypothetical protein [Salmonella enterica]HCK3174219.1 hypothetical protein [Salmonella enterica subsp. enterica serovar Chester]HDN5947682.1 hypothetical protein [Salmonella enterica subsp. enterica serovar Chester]